MKKIFMLAVSFLMIFTAFAFTPAKDPGESKIYASQVYIPIGSSGAKISLLELATISKADLEKLTGKKMNFWEKKAFYGAQKKLQKGIDDEGVITKKKLQKYFGDGKGAAGETGFHLGGFALGFLVGLIGVLIAYLIKDDLKSNRVKWAWIGLGAAIVLSIILVVAVL